MFDRAPETGYSAKALEVQREPLAPNKPVLQTKVLCEICRTITASRDFDIGWGNKHPRFAVASARRSSYNRGMILAEAAPQVSTALIVTGISFVVGLALAIFFIVALVRATSTKAKGWVIACVASGVLTLSAFGVAAKFGVQEVQKFIVEGARIEKPMIGKSGRFRMTVPNNWSPMPKLNAIADIAAGNLLLEQYLMVIAEPKDEVGMGLEEFAKTVTEQMRTKLEKPQQGEFAKLALGTFPALRCRIAGKAEGIDIVYLHTSVETPDHLCQVLCWTLAPREQTAFPIFEKVAATFSAKEKAAAKKGPDPSLPTGERVRRIVAEQLGVEAPKVTATARLKEDLGVDDLDLVELVMALEEEFDITIKDEDADKWLTVADVERAMAKP